MGIHGEPRDETAKSIFLDAVEIASTQGRLAYLDRRCGQDVALRAEVEELLGHHEGLGDYLERPALGAGATRDAAPRPLGAGPGAVIGPYKLLQEIGEGGMGVVFMAEQERPIRRKVALKLIKPGMDSRQVLARFEAERQALALMDHPNIAKVLDAGTTESGRPFFVMELVQGVPITAYCDKHHLAPRERLGLFVAVCRAVQHAHQKGVIHRDLKPSNVLVAQFDGRPVPKVIDFGVAKATGPKLTEATLFTGFGQVVGTLEYMSPEQAELDQLDVDTRSDVYSLGVLLYELLTGTTPLSRKRLRETALLGALRAIREEEPPRPSTRLSTTEELPAIAANRGTEPRKLSGLVRGELDWIVMKCLEKDRARRYETADAVAADLRRYLDDEPVLACPPSTGYRLRKSLRRNKGPVTAASLVLSALLVGTAVSTWQAVRATQAEIAAVAERDEKEKARRAEAQRAEGERLAKLEAQTQQAEAAADAEKAATRQARKRLAQIEKSHEIITSIFTDLDVGELNRGTEPLEAVLARRLVKAAEHLEGEAVGDPLVVAALQKRLGDSLLSLGHAGEAIPLHLKARDTRASQLGADHPDTLTSMYDLGACYQTVGKLDLALPLLEETLKLQRAKLGADHPDTLASMCYLGTSYRHAGKLDLALPLLEETLKIRKAKLENDHPDTLFSMLSLGIGYRAAGKVDLAVPLLKETLKLMKASFGADSPHTHTCMNELARAYRAAGEFDLAVPLLEDALKFRKTKLGADHPNTLTTMHNLAACYSSRNQLGKSIPLFEETLRLQESRLGRNHLDTLSTVANLAVNYEDTGRLGDALPLFEVAYQASKTHASLRWVGPRLLDAYVGARKTDQAAVLARDLLIDARAEHPAASLPLAAELDSLGRSLLRGEAYDEAEPLLREAFAIRERQEPDAWSTFNTQSMLGGAWSGQKRYTDAERLLLQGHDGMKARATTIPPQSQACLAEAVERLVMLYDAWGKPDEAATWKQTFEALRPCVRRQEPRTNPGSPPI